MKKMTCKQLGGACEKEFHANTFEEIETMSKSHGMEMFQQNDKAHLEAMNKMREQMNTADSDFMKKWLDEKRQLFNSLPDN